MDNFTAIRNGLLEHIQDGRLCPFDLGIYVFMHLRADWATGIYHGCALGIAHGFNDPHLKKHIQKSLARLRDRKYINYKKGNGTRGGYQVLIHKYQVTVGGLSGQRLNAWKHGELCKPEYEQWNGDATVTGQSRGSDGAVKGPIQDLLDIKQDVKTRGRRNFVAPTLAEVRAYCLERANAVDPQKWFDHYTANGWKIGRNSMKDWKAAIRTWERNGVNTDGNGNRAQQRQQANLNARDGALDIIKRRMAKRSTDDSSGSVSDHMDGADSGALHRSTGGPA